jgi:hypothetical protein
MESVLARDEFTIVQLHISSPPLGTSSTRRPVVADVEAP